MRHSWSCTSEAACVPPQLSTLDALPLEEELTPFRSPKTGELYLQKGYEVLLDLGDVSLNNWGGALCSGQCSADVQQIIDLYGLDDTCLDDT